MIIELTFLHPSQLERIRSLSDEILQTYDATKYDELLKQFHHFDEDVGPTGKWESGSVTKVCRGWGTTNYLSLEGIYQIEKNSLEKFIDNIDECISDLVDEFNDDLENFTVPERPCDDEIPDSIDVEGSNARRDAIVEDIKEKFECIDASYKFQHAFKRFDPVRMLREYFEAFTGCAEIIGEPFSDTFSGVSRHLSDCGARLSNVGDQFLSTIENTVSRKLQYIM